MSQFPYSTVPCRACGVQYPKTDRKHYACPVENAWVMGIKLVGLLLIVALIGGACWTGWGNQAATAKTDGEAMVMVVGVLIGIGLILYEPSL